MSGVWLTQALFIRGARAGRMGSQACAGQAGRLALEPGAPHPGVLKAGLPEPLSLVLRMSATCTSWRAPETTSGWKRCF